MRKVIAGLSGELLVVGDVGRAEPLDRRVRQDVRVDCVRVLVVGVGERADGMADGGVCLDLRRHLRRHPCRGVGHAVGVHVADGVGADRVTLLFKREHLGKLCRAK